jgi:sugar lactone lactonase YvrE
MLSVLLLLATPAAPPAALALSFGDGPTRMGRLREDESSPEGPGSFAVDAEGRVYILDGVHKRVAVMGKDGALDASIPLPNDTVEDIALLPNGDIAALDRLVDRRVYVLASNGAVVASAPVEGRGVEDGGEVTGVFADASGVWVEVLHGEQVRVLDDKGDAGTRITRPGTPTSKNQFVRLRKVHDGAQILFYDADGRVVTDGGVGFSSLLELSGLVVQGDRMWVAGHELVESKPGVVALDRVVVVEVTRESGRLVEKSRKVMKASPEFVPLKQLVPAGDGHVAHLYVDTTAGLGGKRGNALEVTSW